MAASGMPEGRYTLGGRDVVVDGRTARLADGGSIAGGVATLLEVVRWCVQRRGGPAAATPYAPRRGPPRAPWPSPTSGRWRRGRRADVLVVDDDLRLGSVLRAGQWLG